MNFTPEFTPYQWFCSQVNSKFIGVDIEGFKHLWSGEWKNEVIVTINCAEYTLTSRKPSFEEALYDLYDQYKKLDRK